MAGQAAPRLTQVWLQRGMLAWLLWPASLALRCLVAMRRWLYRMGLFKSDRMPVPVMVVGNVLAGGVGKTPVVMALVRHFQARGLQVGVVSRGYGRQPAGSGTLDCREVFAGATASEVGDEPVLMKRSLSVPIFVANQRTEAARALLTRYPGTQWLVCDDGLQHYALQRDMEICVFDARGVGNGFLLPAGPLREAWPRAPLAIAGMLPPAGLVLCTASDAQAAPSGVAGAGRPPVHHAIRKLADFAIGADGRRTRLDDLRGRPLAAVAAIAQPEQFFAMLRARGLTLAHAEALPDHYDFESWRPKSGNDQTLICTEKDAVKLWRSHAAALAVPLELSLDPLFLSALDAAVDAIGAKLSSPHGRPTA